MKKILKLLTVIPVYIVALLLANIRTLVYNHQNGIGIFNNVWFTDKTYIIAAAAFVFIIIYSDFRLKNNKLFYASLFATLTFSLFNGIFWDKNLSTYILLYFYLILEANVVSKFIKQRFTISIFTFVAIFLIFSVVIAMLNLLFILKYVVIISAIVSIIYLSYSKIRNDEKSDKIIENNFGIGIFTLIFMIVFMGGINRYVHVYDEYSHWAFDAKSVIEYSQLSTNENVVSCTRSYPPALSVWHYFVNIFTNSSNESHFYIGLSLLIIIILMPCFEFVNKKNKVLLPFFFIAIFFSAYLLGNVYSYGSLYADYALSAAFAISIVFTVIFKDDDKKMQKYLFLSLGLCTLIKPSGIVLAGVLIIIKFLEDMLKKNEYKSLFKNFKNNFCYALKKWFKLGITLILLFVIWNVYVKICNHFIFNYYDFTLLPPSLATEMSAKLNGYTMGKIFYNLIKSFTNSIVYGIVDLSMYQFILLMIVLGIIVGFLCRKNNDFNLKMLIPYVIGYLIFFALTLISLVAMFTKYEAENLASFGRYLDPFHYGIMILFIITIFKNFDLEKHYKKSIVLAGILIFFIFNISIDDILYFVLDYSTERQNTYNISYELNEKFETLNANTEQGSQVYVLDQKDTDGIMAMWYARYYAFPRKINANSHVIGWKIRTEKNADDLQDWGLTANDLERQLFDYNFDYLYLYTYDEEMFEKIQFMLNDDYKNIIDKYTIFRVVRDENTKGVSLEPVM